MGRIVSGQVPILIPNPVSMQSITLDSKIGVLDELILPFLLNLTLGEKPEIQVEQYK